MEKSATAENEKDLAIMLSLFRVRAKGIEPIRLTAPDPKSGLSTNFNTPATVFRPFRQERNANVLHFIGFTNLAYQIFALWNERNHTGYNCTKRICNQS